jgi:2-keto-4-pentenoate hydratase/2-oxohepta-3-ene-1,7-dioic acid hydratase in catechol pathway
MKILRFDKGKTTAYGILDGEKVNEISSNYFNSSSEIDIVDSFSLDDVKILSPVTPSKVVCVGLNYLDHAHELNMQIPEEPILFLKPPTSVIGPDHDIICPSSTKELHYEVELAAVISKKAKDVRKSIAMDYLAGFTVLNDVTARDLQRKDIQWTRAKSFDTFCPVGPWIETKLNPKEQGISLKLNGTIKQDSSTSNMIFSVEELVEFISSIMTLEPGDLIATGTPPGVGVMDKGDVVEATIDGIGTLKNSVK